MSGAKMSCTYKYAGDFELWMRFFQHEKLYNVPTILGSFRISNSGQASIENRSKYLEEVETILKDFPLKTNEKRRLLIEAFFEKISFKLRLLSQYILKTFGMTDRSTINNEVYFDFRLQRFQKNA